jgi:phage terminase large subunit
MNWLKSYFFDFRKQSCAIVHSTYLDNKFIDPEYRRVLEELKEQDYNYYRIYALGEWGSVGNLVYTNWMVEDIPTDPAAYKVVYYGMDFGFNDPSVCLAIGYKDNELYIFDEIYRTKLTNSEWIETIKENNIPTSAYIIADSAEPDRIAEFRKSGYKNLYPANKKKHSRKSGIDFLRKFKIHIAPHCTYTIKEIQGYKYKEDRDGNVLDDPIDFNDHCMDALRYGVQFLRRSKPTVKASAG